MNKHLLDESARPTIASVFYDRYIEKNFYENDEFNEPQGLEYNSNNKNSSPIILLGCSFNYGFELDKDKTFQTFLSKQTKRPVYNFSLVAGGFREALFILHQQNIKKLLPQNTNHAKAFIYTYIPSHRERLYANFRPHVPNFKYNLTYTKLTYYNDLPNNKTCLIPRMMNLYTQIVKNNENTFKLIKLYIKTMNNFIKQSFSNYDEETKLIILLYDEYPFNNWEDLEKEGIIVIKLKDLSNENFYDEKYLLPDKVHPNSEAWEIITPALIKKLNL